MRATIHPGTVNGTISAPPSKSMTQRAFAAALLHNGTTDIYYSGTSDDERSALSVIGHLGAKVLAQTSDRITIHSSGVAPISTIIDCGESGLAARLFTPIAALGDRPVQITGSGSLLQRPMQGFSHSLEKLGISLYDFNGYLPITVHGPIQTISFKLDASFGSQLLSGLLLALSYMAKEPITIEVADLKSKPYIDMTLEVLAAAGKPLTHDNYLSFYIDPALFVKIPALSFTIPGDWSGAANMLVAGAIAGQITVNNLQTGSRQADEAIAGVLKAAGAEVTEKDHSVAVKSAPLHSFDFDATHCPDLFPILSILGACCRGESRIQGVHRLFHKESNRAESVSEMLENFGVPFSIEDDALFITGVRHLQGTVIDSFHDHRIVLAGAVGALRARGPVDVLHACSVNKSYPGFFEDLQSVGANCNFDEELFQ